MHDVFKVGSINQLLRKGNFNVPMVCPNVIWLNILKYFLKSETDVFLGNQVIAWPRKQPQTKVDYEQNGANSEQRSSILMSYGFLPTPV